MPMPVIQQIKWPPRYRPTHSPVHVRNEIMIEAPAELVWAWLINAALWPTWYINSSNVCFLNCPPPNLVQGTRFRWSTFGLTITSTVLEFEPYERIAWDAHARGLDAYHAWLIRRTQDGCHVLTEETQHGFLARLGNLVMPERMSRYHEIWLQRLQQNACTGKPPHSQLGYGSNATETTDGKRESD